MILNSDQCQRLWDTQDLGTEHVQAVVHFFYAQAVSDFMIGYHFRKIEHFDKHLPRIVLFWEKQLFPERPVHLPSGLNIFKAHKALGIKRGEIGRWVTLFRDSLQHFKQQLSDSSQDSPKKKFLEQWEQFITAWNQRFLDHPDLFARGH